MLDKIFEFIGIGIITPILYAIYFLIVVISTFIFALPIGVGIYMIDLTIKRFFGGF